MGGCPKKRLYSRLNWLALSYPTSNAALAASMVPIPGTTRLDRLEENIGAVSIELTPGDLRDIETAASKITVQGARYPEKLEQMTGR